MEEENLITTEELNKKSGRRKLAIGIIIGIILGITSIFIATKVLKMIDSNKKDKTDKVEKKEKNKYSLTNKHLKEIVTMLEKKDNITMGVLWRENEDIGPAGSIKKMNLTDIKDLITILYSLDGVPSIKTTEDFDKVCAGQYGISVRESDATVLYSCSFNKGDEQQGVQLFLNSRDIYFFKTNDKLKTWAEVINNYTKNQKEEG